MQNLAYLHASFFGFYIIIKGIFNKPCEAKMDSRTFENASSNERRSDRRNAVLILTTIVTLIIIVNRSFQDYSMELLQKVGM